jgi:molecular chaperone GrpE
VRTKLDAEHELPPADRRKADDRSGTEQVSADGADAEELQKLKAERDSLLDRLARAQAEFENVSPAQRAKSSRILAITLWRMRSSLCCQWWTVWSARYRLKADAAEFRNGVELIYKQLQTALAKLSVNADRGEGRGVSIRIYHDAIEMVETSDAAGSSGSLRSCSADTSLKDRLLRPAMVKVAKNPGK